MNRSWCAVLALASSVLLAGAASAVTLNPHGQGQALIFPYFNAKAGNTTLLTLTNQDKRGKVIRVRVADGENGRSVLAFHVYLAGYDTWSAGIFSDSNTAAAGLVTTDSSCTYPPIVGSTSLPQLPDGRRFVRLQTPLDAGESTVERTREGFIEAIEVASVKQGTTTIRAISPINPGEMTDCSVINAAWAAPSGYWTADSKRDLTNPTGGLTGQLSIVNVAAGTIFSVPSVVLDDFRVDPLDKPRGTIASVVVHDGLNTAPRLNSLDLALSDPATGTVVANLVADGRPLTATYPAGHAFDAVSAVLSTTVLAGDYDTSPTLGATTSFALTFPTRRYYTDRELVNSVTAGAPFATLYTGREALTTLPGFGYEIMDRNAFILETSRPVGGCGFTCPVYAEVRTPNTSVQLVAPGGEADPLLASRLHSDIGVTAPGGRSRPYMGSGWMTINLEYGRETLLPASQEGYRLRGLPVIGTRLVNYVNSNVQAGVLANYAMATPMTSTANCIKNGAVCVP